MASPSPRQSLVEAAARAYEAAHGNPVPEPIRAFRWRLSPRVAVTAFVAVALVVATSVLAARPEAQPVPVAPGGASGSQAPDAISLPGEVVLVHVAGEVARPGLYELPAGSRVADAIDAAGGALAESDTAAINLARRVNDGEQVLIGASGEALPGPSLLNLNAADAASFEALPGIGPVLADRIVADRNRNGPFTTVDDLDRVPGVGKAVLAQIRDLVTV